MGVVYVCKALESNNIFALKTIQNRFIYSEDLINSFKNEALAWINLGRHPNIVWATEVIGIQKNIFTTL